MFEAPAQDYIPSVFKVGIDAFSFTDGFFEILLLIRSTCARLTLYVTEYIVMFTKQLSFKVKLLHPP
jgi:hypothetical protein